MNGVIRRIGFLGFVALMLFTPARALGQSASTEIAAGMEALRAAQYEAAIRHFEAALKLDPTLMKAHRYLATTYAQMYIPGADSADNLAIAERANAEFNWILENNPSQSEEKEVLENLGSLNFQMKHFDSAVEYYHQALALDPKNPKIYYALAVMEWMEAYQPQMELRNSMGLKPTDPMPAGTGCLQLRSMNQEKVEDGIRQLEKTLELQPDDDDAMAYMNLLYRQKAEYECDDPADREADLRIADKWVARTMETKKAKAQRVSPAPPPR